MFKLKNVSKIYSQGEQSVTALSDINVILNNNGFVSIIGESGCGKTTLLNMLAGFDELSAGNISFETSALDIHNENMINEYHRQNVGFVFQEYNVIDELSIWDNVQLSLDIFDMEESLKEELITESLTKVGLIDEKNKKVGKLSGGQKQRVAIARAYAKKPKVILADEPTGNLDYDNSIKIFEMLKNISKNILVVVVTHDKNMAGIYSDRIITLSDGKLVDDIELTNGEIQLKISSGNISETIHDYTDLITFIKAHKNDEYTLKVDVTNNITDSINSEVNVFPDHKRRNISVKKLFQLSREILNKRKFRHVLSIAIFTITISLLLAIFNLALYNEDKVVINYLEKYDENEVIVKKKLDNILKSDKEVAYGFISKEIVDYFMNLSEVETFYQINNVEFSDSNNLISVPELETDTPQDENQSFWETANIRFVTEHILNEKYNIESLNNNEIIISQNLARECKLTKDDIGKQYYLDQKPIILSHIVEGDTNIIYVSQEYMEHYFSKKDKNTLNVSGNFINSKSLFEYANTGITLCDVEQSSNEELINKINKKNNNVILSYSFISQYFDTNEQTDLIGKQFDLIDLYQKKYGNAFSEKMNLYDYIGESVTVVDITEFDGDVYIDSSCFEKITKDYYDIFVYDAIGCYSTNWNNIIKNFHDNGYLVEDENLTDVYDITTLKPTLIKYIAILLTAMLLLTSFLMITIISYSIKDNSKLIGTLKSLGISKKDIKKLFFIQPFKIITTSFVFAVFAVCVIVKYINIEYSKNIYTKAYDILPFNFTSIIVTLLLTCIIGLFTIIIPLKNMDKKTIIENVKY